MPADGPDAKPTLLVLRSHIGWPSPKLTDTAARPRLALRRRRDQGDQGAPRPADGPDLLGPRRGARLLRAADRPRRRAPCGLDRALRGLEGRPRRLGRRAGRARAARLGRRPPPLRGRHAAGHPPCHQPVHRRHGGQAARPAGGLGRPDGQQRREGQGRGDAVARDARRDAGPLRHPRARHGVGHERHGPARGRAAGRRDVLLLLRLHAPGGPPGLPDGDATSSTRGPTTRSAWARTARRTSRSSTWPPCGPCRASAWSARPTPTRRRRPGGWPSRPTGRSAWS